MKLTDSKGEAFTPLVEASSIYSGAKSFGDILVSSDDRLYIRKVSVGPNPDSGIVYNPETGGFDFIC